MVQFHNDKTEYTEGGELTALCWLDASGETKHEFGDAMLAVGGGDDHAIHVVSVTEGRVVKLLKGHGGAVPCTPYPVPRTLYPVPCTPYPVPRTLYPVPRTPYPVPRTPYPKP
jgi:hypothetical protein